MPELGWPELRRRLSATEQSVLRLTGEGKTPAQIDAAAELSPGTAAEMLPRLREKIERMAGQRANGNGAGEERSLVEAAADAAGVEVEDVEPAAGEAETIRSPDESAERAPAHPPIAGSSGTSGFEGDGGKPAPAPPAPGETRFAQAMRLVREKPQRQAELRKALGISSPEMAKLMPRLVAAGVIVGQPVARSPWLTVGDPPPALPERGQEGHELPPLAPDYDGGAGPGDARPGPAPFAGVAPEEERPADAPMSDAELLAGWSPVAAYFDYLALLFERARREECPEHVFDRIEKLMQEGPPS